MKRGSSHDFQCRLGQERNERLSEAAAGGLSWVSFMYTAVEFLVCSSLGRWVVVASCCSDVIHCFVCRPA